MPAVFPSMNGVRKLFGQVPHMPSDGWEPYLPLIEEVEEQQVFMPEFDLKQHTRRVGGQRHLLPSRGWQLAIRVFGLFHTCGFPERPGA